MTQEELNEIAKEHGATYSVLLSEDEAVIIVPLIFHVTLLVNPVLSGGAEHRFCYSNEEIAIKALEEYKKTNSLMYWHKYHTGNISVTGTYAYPPGVAHVPENSLYRVYWDADEIKKQYPHTLKASGSE